MGICCSLHHPKMIASCVLFFSQLQVKVEKKKLDSALCSQNGTLSSI